MFEMSKNYMVAEWYRGFYEEWDKDEDAEGIAEKATSLVDDTWAIVYDYDNDCFRAISIYAPYAYGDLLAYADSKPTPEVLATTLNAHIESARIYR